MPDGTVSQELHHRDLKTLPPDGYVKLRQLPYYDMLVRRDKGSIASMEQQVGGKRNRKEPQNIKMILESLQTWEREYMFKECIAEHNITDKEGNLLDFNSPMSIRNLRPDIGMEIEKYIDELNSEGEEFREDFPNAASSSLEHLDKEPSTLVSTDSLQS